MIPDIPRAFFLTLTVLFSLTLSACSWNTPPAQSAVYRPKRTLVYQNNKPNALSDKSSDYEREYFIAKSFAGQKDDQLAALHFKRAKILALNPYQSQKAHMSALYAYFCQNNLLDGMSLFAAEPTFYQVQPEVNPQAIAWNRNRHKILAIAAQIAFNQANYTQLNHIHKLLQEEHTLDLDPLSTPYTQRKQAESNEVLLASIEMSCLLQRGILPEMQTFLSQADSKKIDTHYTSALEKAVAFRKKTDLSASKARLLNALLPGAGYFYVGQTNTAFTSFCLNALFTAATVRFFEKGDIAAGVIAGSLELGWYIGGINGAGMAAMAKNNRNWRDFSEALLEQEQIWPIFQIESSF